MIDSMDFATVIATFTPKDTAFAPVIFKANGFFNEEEFLSEPQPAKDRARLFMSNDGNAGQYIDLYAISGKRDISIIDGDESDALQKWAYSNPQPLFDFSFVYQRNSQDDTAMRTHRHVGCKFTNHPARAMSNDIVIVRFSFQYSKLLPLDETGSLVGG